MAGHLRARGHAGRQPPRSVAPGRPEPAPAFAGGEQWHGALPDSFMSHQSIVLGGGTEWLEEVSEDDYLAAVADLRLPGALLKLGRRPPALACRNTILLALQ